MRGYDHLRRIEKKKKKEKKKKRKKDSGVVNTLNITLPNLMFMLRLSQLQSAHLYLGWPCSSFQLRRSN